MSVSVCTLARGRDAHLANLVRGLAQSELRPHELVVGVMQDAPYDCPAAPFPIRQIVLGSETIPLAYARNVAARAAQSELLVFLDVDCIPDPACLTDYLSASYLQPGGVLMGEVGYLPKGATDSGIDYARFAEIALKHSERAGPPEGALGDCTDYRCFWSLNFALSASLFERLGGFDERYIGYGGEDTDFGRKITSSGHQLWWVRGAKAYHQYHPHHMPPVHHLDSVLANAAIFNAKWGEPTMGHWLYAFELMGLIKPAGSTWIKLREPGEHDFALTRQQEDAPYASSAGVLALLKERAAAA